MTKKNIAIFASGNGSNAEQFFEHFRNHPSISISCLLSNNPEAYALTRASNNNVASRVFDRNELRNTDNIIEYLKEKDVSHIVLAGFMWLVPINLITSFPSKIFNIHPALLPKYGGKGMYGDHVHKAVIENDESVSGITIHYVNEIYDDGEIIFQAQCPVKPEDDPDSLASRIHKLEYQFYPSVVESVVLGTEIPVQ